MSDRHSAPRRERARHRTRWWFVVIGGGLVVLVVAVALLGGFADRQRRELTETRPGRLIDAGEVTLRLRHAWVASAGPGQSEYSDRAHLFIEADLTNTTDAPVAASNTTTWVRAGSIDYGENPTRAVRLSDLGTLEDLQPDLTTRVVYSWDLDAGSLARGDAVDAVVVARERELGDPVFGDASYGPFDAVVRVPMTVGAGP